MTMRKIINILLLVLLSFTMFIFPASAENISKDSVITAPSELLDSKVSTYTAIDTPVKISGDAKFIYIIFWDEPCDFTISNNVSSMDFEGKFLHRLVEIPQTFAGKDISVTFKNNAKISELKTFSQKPDDTQVQAWDNNNEVCDLLIFSTHADDEQLFFSGVIPLYATDGITDVQIIYFTDHNNNIARRHELLNGLWEVGIRRYPIISKFPDAYSESYEGALKNLEKAGYTEDDALRFQVEQICKFKPLVILGHDLKGEYGHGQHILNATLLTRAVEVAANGDECSDMPYGLYNTPKLYLHLYSENKIELNLDTPITNTPYERFNGKTPFQISKVGFSKHVTQQGTWFKTWLNGKNGEITKASQIKKYSPREFGLYRTLVGEDINKNDIFENVTRRALLPKEDPILNVPAEVIPDESPKKENPYGTYVALTFCILAVIGCVIAIRKRKK